MSKQHKAKPARHRIAIKTKAEPAPRIWAARQHERGWTSAYVLGYLISEPGNPNAMLAFVYDAENYGTDKPEVLRNARSIAAEPWRGELPSASCLDLRPYGRPDSTRAVPGWLYSLRLAAVPDGADKPEETDVEFSPFCPVRLARMVDQALQASGVRVNAESYPVVGVGRFAEMSDNGVSPVGNSCVVALPPRPWP